MTDHEPLKDYLESLDAALSVYFDDHGRALDAHNRRHGVPWFFKDKISERRAAMQAITNRATLPRELRLRAKHWLTKRGFDSFDDGDL